MDLLPSGEQTQIVDMVRSFLAAEAPLDRLRAHGAIGNPDAALWAPLAELGVLGLGLPEAAGGVGLGAAEEMLVFREFGRNLISPGVLGATLAARAAAVAGDAVLRDAILGGAPIGLANARAPGDDGVDAAFHLFEAAEAEWVLVLSPDRAGVFPRAAFAEVSRAPATDASLILERGRLDGAPRVSVEATAEPLFQRALLALAAYAVGLSEATRDMAVDYAKVREQFGRPIGGFQAVKHICADMAIRAEAALCQASFAALVVDAARADTDFQVTASKIVAVDAAVKNAAANIQVHGAFGFTAEANAHHFLKRAHVTDLLWGDLREQRARLLAMPGPM